MDRLTVPKVGDPLQARWAQEVVDEIRRQEIIPGNGLNKKKTAKGTILEWSSSRKSSVVNNVSPGPGTSFLAKVIGGSADSFWQLQIYPNGMNGSESSGIYYACANEMWGNGANLIGKWVIVHFFPCAVISGEEFP